MIYQYEYEQSRNTHAKNFFEKSAKLLIYHIINTDTTHSGTQHRCTPKNYYSSYYNVA